MKCADQFIKLLGVGGCGINVACSVLKKFPELRCAVADSDFAKLQTSPINQKVLIGKNITRNLSAGTDFEVAQSAVEESSKDIFNVITGTNLLFIVGALSGAMGSALALKSAKIAKENGAKVIAFCFMPFDFEGQAKQTKAEEHLNKLRKICDIVIALPNEEIVNPDQSNIEEAFSKANDSISNSIWGICKMLSNTGLINTDFTSFVKILCSSKSAKGAFSYGMASGSDCTKDAIISFNNFPTLNYNLNAQKADKLLVWANCSADISMDELKSVLINAASKFSNNEEVIFGANIDKEAEQTIEVFAIGLEILEEEDFITEEEPSINIEIEKIPTKEIKRRTRMQTPKPKLKPKNDLQSEFGFVEEELKRGYFEYTMQNIYNGEDLDIPSFIRKKKRS